jgi:hypothetical protein
MTKSLIIKNAFQEEIAIQEVGYPTIRIPVVKMGVKQTVSTSNLCLREVPV